MKNTRMLVSTVVTVFGLTLIPATNLCGDSTNKYELIVLDSSTNESCAYGVNSIGFACGSRKVGGIAVPYLWSPAHEYIDLSYPSASVLSQPGIAYAIDDDFDVVGTYGSYYATQYYPITAGTGAMWLYSIQAGDFFAYVVPNSASARDISINGDVVGNVINGSSGYVLNIYSGNIIYSGLAWSMFTSVNAQGSIGGMFISDTMNSTYSPFLMQKQSNGTMSMISGAGIGGNIFIPGSALKVNSSNEVVGLANNQGFYWNALTGSNTLLGANTICYSLNDNGYLVGATNGRACMWMKCKGKSFMSMDLNSLHTCTNIVLEKALCINNKGYIVGQCRNTANGAKNAFLLAPARGVRSMLTRQTNSATNLTLSWGAAVNHYYAVHESLDLRSWSSSVCLSVSTNRSMSVVPDTSSMFYEVYDITP